MIDNLKARFAAQKFNVWTEQIDDKRKADNYFSGYFYANGKLYYGHPLFVFFESASNSWFKNSESLKNILLNKKI
jgi:hypothetical protein